jgi:hypothetical protein
MPGSWSQSWRSFALYALGYLISPFGPSCVTHRPWILFRPTLPLWVVMAGAPALATLFVGLYVALGVSNLLHRLAAIVLVVLGTLAAGMGGSGGAGRPRARLGVLAGGLGIDRRPAGAARAA